MKIAILTPTFSYYSGPDRVAELQAKEYAKKGHKITIFTLEGEIEPKNFKLEILDMPKRLFITNPLFMLIKFTTLLLILLILFYILD